MKKNSKQLVAIGAAFLIIGGSIVSCKKSSNTNTITPPTPLGGYISSDSVAPGNLVAYWPMDGNVNDTKGGQTGTAVGVTFTTGKRGQAYQGATHAYATVPASSAFSGLASYSYSMWYKLAAQPAAGDPGGLFFLSGATTQNELIYELESYSPVSHDSVKVHHGFNDLGSPAYQLFVMESYDTSAIGGWIHLVTTYDAATSIYTIYENGVAIGNNSAFGQNINPTHMWTDGTMTTPLGSLSFSTDPPTQVILGTWPAGLFGVSPTLGSNGCFEGQMDEIRIYNKALSAAEVNGLYLNGNR